jgi:hypothetical protein
MKEGRDWGVDARLLAGQDRTWRLQGAAAGRGGPVEALISYYGFGSDGPQLFTNQTTGVVDKNEDSLVHQVGGKVRVGPVALDADFTAGEIGRPGGQQISTVGNCGRCHYTPNDVEYVQNFNAGAQVDQQVTDNLRVFAQGYTFFKRRVTCTCRTRLPGTMNRALGKRPPHRWRGRARCSPWETCPSPSAVTTRTTRSTTPTSHHADGGGHPPGHRRWLRGRGVPALQQAGAQRGRPLRPLHHPREGVERAHGPDFPPCQHRLPRAARADAAHQLRPRLPRAHAGGAGHQPADVRGHAGGQPRPARRDAGYGGAGGGLLALQPHRPPDGTGFYNLAKNFINQQLVFGSTSEFRNIGDARVLGFEAEAAAQVAAINSSFDVAYQYLDARALPFDGRPEQVLEYAPTHRIYVRGRTNFGQVAFAELYGLYVGERYDRATRWTRHRRLHHPVQLPGYVTATARVGANITKGLSVSLLGSNLFNAKYEESHGFPAPPVSIFSEVKYQY